MDLATNDEFSAYWGKPSGSTSTGGGSQERRGSVTPGASNTGALGDTAGGNVISSISLGTPSAEVTGISGSTPQTSVVDLPSSNSNPNVSTLPASTPGGVVDRAMVGGNNLNTGFYHDSSNNNGPGADAKGRLTPFDPMDHARLSPTAFDPSGFSGEFIMPRFVSGGSADPYGYGVAIAEPMASRDSMVAQSLFSESGFGEGSSSMYSSTYPTNGATPYYSAPSLPSDTTTSMAVSANAFLNVRQTDMNSLSDANTKLTAPSSLSQMGSTSTPVYTPYGSSIVSVATAPQISSKHTGANPATLPSSSNPGTASSPFNPAALGLPVPPPAGTSTNFAGLYSSSGFDMISVLARVAVRPNQTIQIGPVDTSCAFLVVDAKKFDMPIVFASETFTKMTNYRMDEIIGRNCRFLQSPDGMTVQGQPRKFTEGNAAWHMRNHIAAGKESQTSLINYMKGGKPFINLVTVVPISWDTDEIAYYVGFQVDLVNQPSAIMDRMKDGTYVVNYSLFNNPARAINMASTFPADVEEAWPMEDISAVDTIQDDERTARGGRRETYAGQSNPTSANANDTLSGSDYNLGKVGTTAADAPVAAAEDMGGAAADKEELEVLDMLTRNRSLDSDTDRKQFHRLLLKNVDDFIHVLSLKGSMLYCSPSAAAILEYEPSELIGKSLQALCHPSDVVPVMRQLKDSSSSSQPYVSLLYRIRRKHSGYIWMEGSGKLHIEPGKGRKCVILVGRPREVYKMSWSELRAAGGLGDSEFWMKLSPTGVILNSTSSLKTVLGREADDVVGTSLLSMAGPEYNAELVHALQKCDSGMPSVVRYKIKGRRGYTDVVTRFYPRTVNDKEPISLNMATRHLSVLAQTNAYSSEQRKSQSIFVHQAPAYQGVSKDSPSSAAESDSSSNDPKVTSSTFKTLSRPSLTSDNVFDELDTTRCTSWQYELHLLQNINKRLRDEKEHLLSLARQKKVVLASLDNTTGRHRRGSSASSRASSRLEEVCANCGKVESPDWRTDSSMKKELCNDCVSRRTDAQKLSINSPSSVTSEERGSDSPIISPNNPISAGMIGYVPSTTVTPSSHGASESPMSWM